MRIGPAKLSASHAKTVSAASFADRLGVNLVAKFSGNDVSASRHSRKPLPGRAVMLDAGKRGDYDCECRLLGAFCVGSPFL